MTDDGLHEVQLNGKQLVFLFMVGTVIAVVIFLCGVLVGRGLRPPSTSLELASADAGGTVDPTQEALVDPTRDVAPAGQGSTPSSGTPVSAQESLTYAERLGSPNPLPDDIRTPSPRPPTTAKPPAAAAPKPPAAAPKPAPPVTTPATAALAEPPGRGYVVQVMAVNTRSEAEAVARRLGTKGYPAFVTTTGAGTRVSYRVRVGKYDTQREAEAISARLQKEEQFKPWVTR
jgi:septal ring-binding cell division protein DamX